MGIVCKRMELDEFMDAKGLRDILPSSEENRLFILIVNFMEKFRGCNWYLPVVCLSVCMSARMCVWQCSRVNKIPPQKETFFVVAYRSSQNDQRIMGIILRCVC